MENETTIQKIQISREKLYESISTGEVSALDLIKVIKNHLKELDIILESCELNIKLSAEQQ